MRKLRRRLVWEGIPVGSDRARRLIIALGLGGVTWVRTIRTIHPRSLSQRPVELVNRSVQRVRPEPALTGRYHLRLYSLRLLLHRLHRGCLQSGDRRLAGAVFGSSDLVAGFMHDVEGWSGRRDSNPQRSAWEAQGWGDETARRW